jgi:hypothetical protein
VNSHGMTEKNHETPKFKVVGIGVKSDSGPSRVKTRIAAVGECGNSVLRHKSWLDVITFMF